MSMEVLDKSLNGQFNGGGYCSVCVPVCHRSHRPLKLESGEIAWVVTFPAFQALRLPQLLCGFLFLCVAQAVLELCLPLPPKH